MQMALRNSMICGLAAIMAGILTACRITKATIDTIAHLFSHPNSTFSANGIIGQK